MTNDARHGEDDFVRKLWGLGFQAAREEIVTAGGALQHVLAEAGHATAFVIGSDAVHRHVTDAGLRILNDSDMADRADVVVVSGHEGFDFAELRGAVQAVLRGAEVWCTSRDATFPMPDGPWPATGSVVAAVEAATGVDARSVGKPEPQLFLTALDRLGDGRALVDRRPPRRRRGGRARRRDRRRDRAHRRHQSVDGPRGRPRAHVRGRQPGRAAARPVRKRTHHKHSSKKGYRRLLDRLAAHEAVHRVATGRVTPRMGAGRPVAPISKVRQVASGLSITINTEGAMVDAYVVTDRPDEVADFIKRSGWSR